jgi:glyoxylase-like metal-dependent hydrolase (beta-lactamase superfamily II)
MSLDFRAVPFADGYVASLEILSSEGRPRLSAVLPAHGDQSVKVEHLTADDVQRLIAVLTATLPRMKDMPADL